MPRKKMSATPGEDLKIMKKSAYDWYKSFSYNCPKNPTRKFNVGDKVRYGAWQDSVVDEVLDDGIGYGIISKTEKCKKGLGNESNIVTGYNYVPWMSLYPVIETDGVSDFTTNEDLRISFANTAIESLIHDVYHFGVDFEPDYQRGDVWGDEDREKLLDSIFMGADIGRFLFAEKDWEECDKQHFEIVDGKQRLKTLCAFYEDRFRYRGYFYSELFEKDKRTFKEHGVLKAVLRNAPKEKILRYFLVLNRGGKPMDEEWLRHVESMLHSV